MSKTITVSLEVPDDFELWHYKSRLERTLAELRDAHGCKMFYSVAAEEGELTISQWQRRYAEFAEKTWPTATPEGTVRHLKDEVQEEIHPGCATTEWADVFFFSLHMAKLEDFSLSDAVTRKFDVLKRRKWPTEANAAGYFPHEPDGETDHL